MKNAKNSNEKLLVPKKGTPKKHTVKKDQAQPNPLRVMAKLRKENDELIEANQQLSTATDLMQQTISVLHDRIALQAEEVNHLQKTNIDNPLYVPEYSDPKSFAERMQRMFFHLGVNSRSAILIIGELKQITLQNVLENHKDSIESLAIDEENIKLHKALL